MLWYFKYQKEKIMRPKYTLQEVCSIRITDWTHQTPTYCGEKEWIPFISSKDVTKQYIDWEWWIKYIPQSLHEELYKRIAPQKDDILLAKNGTTWVAAIVEDDRIFDIYVTLAVLRPNQKIITPRFLHKIVNSPICKRQFDKSLKWAGVPNLHLENIKKVEIPLPSLETQKAIVAKLDQIFAELDQTKSEIQKNLDNTDELWKSAYDRILSIKWDENSLEDLCEIVDYRWKTPKKTNKWILLVTAKNIRKWYIDYEKSKEYISEDDYDEVMHRWLPKIWDILFTTEAPCWNVAIIDNENIALAQRVVKYRPKNKEYLNNKYLLYVLLWNEFQKKLEMHSTWWTVKWIKWKILHKLTIPVPPLSEQEKIVEHLDQVSKEVKALKSQYQSQLDNLEELKKSVLDKAFRWELL